MRRLGFSGYNWICLPVRLLPVELHKYVWHLPGEQMVATIPGEIVVLPVQCYYIIKV